MIKNYIKVSLKSLFQNKAFSVINIFGLALGLTCCLLMILLIKNEVEYDAYNKNADRIYRVALSDFENQGGFATTPFPIGPALKEQLPEIRASARINPQPPRLFAYNNNYFFETFTFADADIFKIFSIPFIAGNPATSLNEPHSIVISESLAKKYFGNEDPLNKTIKIGSTGSLSSTVKGVFKDLPQNSQLQFNCLASFSTLSDPTTLWRQMPGNYTYILVDNKEDAKKLSAKLPSFIDKNVGEELRKNNNLSYSLTLQPLKSIHLKSHLQSELPGAGNLTYLYLFAAIAFIILFIACINFVNFSIAAAIKRTKEIGMRKIMGASQSQLVQQFLNESLLIYLFASTGALLLACLLLPLFNHISDKYFTYTDLLLPLPIGALMLIGVIAGVLSGFFPAWSISRLSSLEALKGKTNRSGWKTILNKSLITTQFIASIALIVGTLVIYRQMSYIRSQTARNNGDQVVVFRVSNKLAQKSAALKNQLLANSNILSVSFTANVPGFADDAWEIRRTENSPALQAQNYVADEDFIKSMKLSLVAGRELDGQSVTDVKEGFIVNETACRDLGFSSPQEAIGRPLLWGSDEKKRGTIIGVAKDFHFRSFHEKISPTVIQFAPYKWMSYSFALVKLKPVNIAHSIDVIRKTAFAFDENWLVDYKFFDENFALMHKKDERQGEVLTVFALIAVIISCLGLFGLTMHATAQRVKEIGVRKVLGASITSVAVLLSKDFLKLVFIAILIASPVAYYFTEKWLQDFAYRIAISWQVFALAGFIALLIALLTVSFQAIKAALANPVKSLRTE